MRITLTDTAKHHDADDSIDNLVIIIDPAGVNNVLDNDELTKSGIRILYHDLPVRWISPLTSREYLLVFNDEFEGKKISKAR